MTEKTTKSPIPGLPPVDKDPPFISAMKPPREEAPEPSITINGKNYLLKDLPESITALAAIYKKWEDELADAKIEVFKVEAALRGLTGEIQTRINNHEAQRARMDTPKGGPKAQHSDR